MNFAVVIPAYNEAATIDDVVTRALAITSHVIVINDGSDDETGLIVKKHTVTLIDHETNMGKAQSLWDGMQAALALGVDAVITLDGDGQHSPEDIPRFIEAAQHSPDTIIIGSRLADKSEIPPRRYYANKVANFWIAWAAGYPIADSQSGFRLYPANLIKQLRIKTTRDKSFVFESEVIIKAAQLGIKSQPLKIPAVYAPNARPSHFRSVMDIVLITRMVAWSLISRAFYLPGFYRAFIKPRMKPFRSIGWDGIAMLVLSFIILGLTFGVSYLCSLIYSIRVARYARTDSQDCDCILLLGMQLENNLPNTFYKQRIARAIKCLEEDSKLFVYVLGGITADANISEADAGKQSLTDAGIDASRIQLEDKSRHTLENLKQAQLLLKEKQWRPAIISNRFHLPRVNALAGGLKLNHKLCAAEDVMPINLWTFTRLSLEALYIHWFYVGKIFAHVTHNRYMLDRIT